MNLCNNCKSRLTLYCSKYNKSCISYINKNQERQVLPCQQCIDENGFEEGEYIFTEKTYENTAYFHIPDIYILNNILALLNLKKKYPGAFFDNREIIEIYGAFAGCIWNGRTPLFGLPYQSIQEINHIKDLIEENNLSLNLTWNNSAIADSQVYDTYCNLITELFHNGKHAITVGSLPLLQYLKDNFPNYIYYSSIITAENNDMYKYDENFDIQLLSTFYNNNWPLLYNIPEEERSHIELLCNDRCPLNCGKQEHYNIANYCLSNCAYESSIFEHPCPIDTAFSFVNMKNNPITIAPNQIELYLQNGFHHFKLAGRGDSKEIVLYKICQYFVRPDFFEDIYFNIIGA